MKDFNETYIANDNYAKSLGIKLVEVGNEFARCELEVNDNHKNSLGSLHGAVIFALAYIAFAAACNTEKTSIGMQSNITYLNKPTGGKLIAEAKVVSTLNEIGHYQVCVTDNEGTHIAQFSSISYRLSK